MGSLIAFLIVLGVVAYFYRAGKKLGSRKGYGAALRRRPFRRWRR